MEILIVSDLNTYLLKNNLITRHQHGFLTKHSTCTQLLETLNDWTLFLKSKLGVDSVYLDFAKAFDTVSHVKLLTKLTGYGIREQFLFGLEHFYLVVPKALKLTTFCHLLHVLKVAYHKVVS